MTTLVLQPDTTGGIDTTLHEGSPNNNYGVRGDIRIGYQASTTEYRGLIKFDLSSIPSNAILSAATLSLYLNSEALTTDVDINVHRSLVEWYEGDADGSAPSGDGSTWNNRNHNGSVAWTGGAGGVSGTEYDATPTDTTTITGPGVFFDWDVLADVQAFFDGTYTNYGWWTLVASYVSPNLHKTFLSSDWGTAAQRPKLTVEYIVPSGTATGTSTVTGTMSATVYISGTIAGTSSQTAHLISNKLFGTIPGTSTAIGDLNARGYLSGTAAGTSTVTGDITATRHAVGTALGTSTVTGDITYAGIMRGTAEGIAAVSGIMWGKYQLVASSIRFSAPLLYITDGTVKSNGQHNRLHLNGPNNGYGFCVQDWRPIVLDYKDGGYWNDSPIATGRRLVSRSYGNIIEVFELSARSPSQDGLIQRFNELYRWLEAAADYWVSGWTSRPIYLVARGPYEENERYAIIHHGSVPELESPYRAPFFMTGHNFGAAFGAITLRLEHGIWQDSPPRDSSEVSLSSYRSYTVTGWSS